MPNLKPLSILTFFFFHRHLKGFSSKHIALKVDVIYYRTGKYTVCRCVRASFSPKGLHAGAVKGLNKCQQMSYQWYSVSDHLCGPHKDTSDWCRVNSMSVWVVIGVDFTSYTRTPMTGAGSTVCQLWVVIRVDFTSFTRTPVTGVGSTLCRCECSSEWILLLSQGHQRLLFDHS